MRTIDISSLVTARAVFIWLAQVFGSLGIVAVVTYLAPAQGAALRLSGGAIAIVMAFALYTARFPLTRAMTAALGLWGVVVFGWLSAASLRSHDAKTQRAMLYIGVLGLVVSLVPAIACRLKRFRAAEGSPYLKTTFATKRALARAYAPGGPGLVARIRAVRILPILVFLLLVALAVSLSMALRDTSAPSTAAARRTQNRNATATARNVVFLLGGGIWVWAKRRSALRGAELRRIDSRRPVLLLRSFGDDSLRLSRAARWSRDLRRQALTFELLIAQELTPFGPIVAIGKPGERLAPLGAARDYVEDGVWRDAVQARMRAAAVVVLIVGTSEGLAWELARLRDLRQLHKLILVFPPSADVVTRWRTLVEQDRAGGVPLLPGGVRPERTLALVYADDLTPIVIEGKRNELSYQTAVRIGGMLAITTGAEPRPAASSS